MNFAYIDTIRNIFANKFCTIASRLEPKDFIDFYFLNKALKTSSLLAIYEDARKKDAIFDDPPTVAYQIEQGFQFLQNNSETFPQILCDFDMNDPVDLFTFFAFCHQ